MRDYLAIADQYAADVLSGAVVAGEFIRLACTRYLSDKKRAGTDPDFDYVLSHTRATHACMFIESMPHIKGKLARPVNGVFPRLIMEPWQIFATVNLFGWVDDQECRRFLFCYIEVAKKNGKSTWLAAVCLYMATADGEPGPEIYTVATNYDQAKIVWSDAKAMLLKTPELIGRYDAATTIYDVKFEANNGIFKPLATDKNGRRDGLNIHLAAVDELHAHPDSQTYDIVADGIASREQPLVIAITTAGTDRTGVAYRERTVLVKILTGNAAHERYFGMIFCLDQGDNWRDESVWAKANPSLGASIDLAYLQTKFEKVALSPSSEAMFRQKSLNEWVGAASSWVSVDAWDALKKPRPAADVLAVAPKFGGIDMASKLDLAGFVDMYAIHVPGETKPHWHVSCSQFVNEAAAKSAAARSAESAETRTREIGNACYPEWAGAGWLTITPGNVTDQDEIERALIDSHSQSHYRELGYDNYNATMLAGHLMADGVPMVDVPMRVNPISPAMRWIEELILERRISHDGNPVLAWCLGNVIVAPDNNQNIYPRKSAPDRKIDAAVALFIAASRARLWDSAEVFDAVSVDGGMDDYLRDVVRVRM